MLNFTTFGEVTDKPTLLIAHGLFGSARNWGVIAKRLSDERQVVAVDMRNHGESPWTDSHLYPELADDLAEVVSVLRHPVDVLGHSMGGKATMALGLKHPESLNRLVIADIAPVAYSHSQTALIQAMRSVDLAAVSKRSDADIALSQSIDDRAVRAFLLQSLDVKNRTWRLNLDVLERDMQQITGWPAHNTSCDAPTLFLRGNQSDYVTEAGRSAARALFPNARFASLAGAGHWLHADKPREFEATVRIFLNA